MLTRLRSWWKNTNKKLVIVGIIALLAVIALVITVVRLYGTGFAGKTLWEWLNLLGILAIPVVVGFGTVWFTQAQQHRDQLLANQRAQADHDAAERRAQAEREIAADNQREAAMKEYFDQTAELLLHEKLRESGENDEVRIIARVRTLTVLPRLDGQRKSSVLQFLHESGLIYKDEPIIDLSGADLNYTNLYLTNLRGASLRNVSLDFAKLIAADLRDADLRDAKLIRANLSFAILQGADLSHAVLSEADLSHAELDEANLSGAIYTTEQLKQASFLSGATMPDGKKHN